LGLGYLLIVLLFIGCGDTSPSKVPREEVSSASIPSEEAQTEPDPLAQESPESVRKSIAALDDTV